MVVLVAKTILPDRSRFFVALRRVFGLGRAHGLALAEQVGVSQEMRVADVKASHVRQVVALVNERYQVGDELKRALRDDILALIGAKSYRGGRHAAALPARGQRTHTNSHTARKFRRHLDYDVK